MQRYNPLIDPSMLANTILLGAIQRIIRFQFSLTSIGTMGWMFRTFCVRANGPIPKLLLFWTGTLMSLATGFWTAFCKLAAPSRLVWLVKRTPIVLQTECQRKESTKATTLLQSLSPVYVRSRARSHLESVTRHFFVMHVAENGFD